MNPPATETTFAELIRGCVEQKGNDDWVAFRARTETLVHRVFLHYCHCGHLVDEFEDWFYGWLAAGHQSAVVLGHRLQAALNALRIHYQAPEHIYIPEREQYAWRYFRCIVQSGCAVFLGEINSHLPVASDVDPDTTPGHNPGQAIAEQLKTAEQWEQVRAVVCQLPQRHRIPFWLRYRARLGPLLTADEQHLRNLHEDSTGWLDDQLRAFENGKAPSKAIAEVLGGLRIDCVDQRIHYATERIQERLGLPD